MFRVFFSPHQVETEGLSGLMRFDNQTGLRSFFTLEMVELTNNGFKKIGLWDPEKGMTYTRTSSEMLNDLVIGGKNKTFIVASKIVSRNNRIRFATARNGRVRIKQITDS